VLIGCKNKDQYVENFLTILLKKNKINPYTCLARELKAMNDNYILMDGQKTLDMNRLVDYATLTRLMSGRYFFRKILKHIKPETYRGFYILSRFHLIHYLIKLCKGQPTTKAAALIEQFLEIFFLASQHAA
jgi:E3 ubiquitin-protein ligase HUWE1